MNPKFAAGDTVAVHGGNTFHVERHLERVAGAPQATIVRLMPHSMAEYGRYEYELNTGVVEPEGNLELLERAPAVVAPAPAAE